MTVLRVVLAGALALGSIACGTKAGPANEVIVYTALDEMYSQPVLDDFEKQTGIDVRAVYDTEASKTTGLRTRLVAEEERPRADVFWNNEVAQTILLKDAGVLESYRSPTADAIPAQYKDPTGYWTGFAARARVIIYNTRLVSNPPSSILDYLKPEWKGKAAIARPLFGTTATQAAALFAAWGPDKAVEFFQGLRANGVAVLEGNAAVRDRVAAGDFAWGLTDTDDANGAKEDGLPALWAFPDQGPGGMGTLVIPNTVALVKGAPHPDAAKRLIDYLLSPEVEAKLASTRSIQIPLNPNVNSPKGVPRASDIDIMDVTFDRIAAEMPKALDVLQKEFVR